MSLLAGSFSCWNELDQARLTIVRFKRHKLFIGSGRRLSGPRIFRFLLPSRSRARVSSVSINNVEIGRDTFVYLTVINNL